MLRIFVKSHKRVERRFANQHRRFLVLKSTLRETKLSSTEREGWSAVEPGILCCASGIERQSAEYASGFYF